MTPQRRLDASYWPVRWAILAMLLVLFEGMSLVALARTGGHFGYVLDDAYIHLAIARNVAQHGIWGVTRYATSSASSSPLWTLLLACWIAVVGDRVWLPLALNVGFALLTAAFLQVRFAKAGFTPLATLGWAVGIVFGGPLAVLAFTGMEHDMHTFLVLLYSGVLLNVLNGNRTSRKMAWLTLAITAVMTLARFESGFLVVVPLLLAVRRRDFALALPLVAGPVLAIVGFAVYSRSVGMPPIPNSIVLKGAMPSGSAIDFIGGLPKRVSDNVFLDSGRLVLVIACIAVGTAISLGRRHTEEATAVRGLLWTLVVATGLQAAFGAFGWFYRYEAYLVVSTSFAILLGLRHFPTTRAATVAGGLLCAALLLRGLEATSKAPRGIQDIYLQQVQMAKFLGRYYPGGSVAVNDIGAVSYYAEPHLLDLWGLANDDVRALKRKGAFTTAAMAELLDKFHPDVLIVYPDWFKGMQLLPPTLHEVATWTIPPTTSAAFPVVALYATDAPGERRLRAALAENQANLPGMVTQEFLPEAAQ